MRIQEYVAHSNHILYTKSVHPHPGQTCPSLYCLPKIHNSPLVEVSLVIYNRPALSNANPAGLKHPELKLGPLPAHLVTSVFQKISLAPVLLVIGATGLYCPSAPLVNGTCTNLKPVVGWRFQLPWYETYKLVLSASNLRSIGAECGKRVKAGLTAWALQVSSFMEVDGVCTNQSPTANFLSVKSLGCQTVKHVG
jgi:hypothetical protein